VVTVPEWPIVGRQAELTVFEGALSAGEHAGLLIHGRAGVGKTRLADECRQLAAAAGHPTERVFGSRSTAGLPLGAVAALFTGGLGLPGPDGQLDTAGLFEQSRRALHHRHGGRRLVIVADDVSLIDSASLALLGYLAAQGTIFLIATVRSGEPVPDLVTGLWREGRLERVDLADLSRADLGTLLHLTLDGPVEAGTGREFWEVTGGNPRYVRELVLGCLESGALVERAGVWHLEGPVPSTARLADLVGQRIEGLSAGARSLVELLALCQPLELEYLEAAAPVGVLESLERAGLVTIAVAEGEVRLAHPLHGTVVRAAMPRSRARAILLAQAARLEAAGPAGPAALRIAVWRLDAGGQPDPAVLVRGAHLARHAHDFRTVGRLIEAAEAGYADHLALGAELAIAHPAMHLVNQVFALAEAGRLADAERLATEGAEIVAAYRLPIAQIFFAANLGRVATLQGRLATARRYYAEAAGLAQAHRFAGPRRLALSGLALAHAMRGEADAAAQALTERDTGPAFSFRGPEQQLANAWTAHASGRPAVAAGRFRDAAAQAASTGHRTAEAWLLHDLMRTSGQDTSARLRELARACDSPLLSARARHAAARASDAQELADAAGDFEALGAMLLAAEAASAAAGAFSRAGDRRAAAAALRHSNALAASCEGAATPGLFHAAVPLSGRERQIVMLAVKGMASKDIAERLFLSVRTVSNHLQHAYTKLGVTSRASLAEALGSS